MKKAMVGGIVLLGGVGMLFIPKTEQISYFLIGAGIGMITSENYTK